MSTAKLNSRRMYVVCLVAALTFGLTTCGGGGGSSNSPTPNPNPAPTPTSPTPPTPPTPTPSSEQVVVFGNSSDSHIAERQEPDGTVIDYWGTKDASGLTTALKSAIVTSQGEQFTFTFDTKRRPLSMQSSDGFSAQFVWQSDTAGQIIFSTSAGAVASTTFNLAQISLGSTSASVNKVAVPVTRQPKSSKPATTELLRKTNAFVSLAAADTPGGAVSACPGPVPKNASVVNVNACGGATQLGDVASVAIVVNGLPGHNGTFPGTSVGNGAYSVSLPIQDPNAGANAGKKCSSLASWFFGQSTVETAATTCETIDKALEAGEQSCKVLVDERAIGTCELGFKVGQLVCKVATGGCDAIASVVDAYQSLASLSQVSLQAMATVSGATLGSDVVTADINGPFQCFTIDFGTSSLCDPAAVTVSPPSANISIGQTVPLNATVKNKVGQSVTPQLSWTSSDVNVASVLGTTALAANVTGRDTGQSTITAAATNGASGTATVTVGSSSNSLTGNFTGSIQGRASFISRDPQAHCHPGTDTFNGPAFATVEKSGTTVHISGLVGLAAGHWAAADLENLVCENLTDTYTMDATVTVDAPGSFSLKGTSVSGGATGTGIGTWDGKTFSGTWHISNSTDDASGTFTMSPGAPTP